MIPFLALMRFIVALLTMNLHPSLLLSPEEPLRVSGETIGNAADFSLVVLPGDDQDSRRPASSDVPETAPFTLEIRTVPPIEGIPFLIEGRRLLTDDAGILRTKFWRKGVFEVEVLIPEFQSAGMRLEFARWGDYVFLTRRDIEINSSVSVEAGFHVMYPVQLEFVNSDGVEFPSDDISSVELRSSIGDILAFEGNQPQWLQSIQVLGRDFGLDPVEIVYSVQRVVIHGSNVVNRGQQRFTVSQQGSPQIELLLFPVELASRDALFGFPLGRGFKLRLPDGSEEAFQLDIDSRLRIDSLARGTYRTTATGVFGFAIPTTFVLSREQEVEMIIISILDMVSVALAATLALVGLAFIGRPDLLDRFRARFGWGVGDSRETRQNPTGQGDEE